MATQCFRITAYSPAEDLSAIFDSNGMFEKLWQFSSYLLQKGFKVIEVSSDEKFLDGNIEKVESDTEHIILRAIAKDSKIILADEPTGNLDSETGSEIFNILKELSQEKLVVVVTHDRENAERFGDRVIKISDGKIVSDYAPNTAQDTPSNTAANALNNTPSAPSSSPNPSASSFKKAKLGLGFAFKMAFRNLSVKKFRTVIAVILTTLTVLTVCISQIFFSYDTERNLLLSAKKIGKDYLTYRSISGTDQYGYPAFSERFSKVAEEYLSSQKVKFFKEYSNSNVYGAKRYIINDLAQLKYLGIELYDGYKPLSDDNVYVSDYFLAYNLDNYGTIDCEGDFTFEKAAGCTLTVMSPYPGGGVEFTERIAGVFKTDYLKYGGAVKIDKSRDQKNLEAMQDFITLANASFCTQGYLSSVKNFYRDGVEVTAEDAFHHVVFKNGDNSMDAKEKSVSLQPINYSLTALTQEGYKEFKSETLNPGEIIISLSLYNDLFGQEIEPLTDDNLPADYDVENSDTWYLADYVPQNIGKYIDIQLIQNELQQSYLSLSELKVVGIMINGLHDPPQSLAQYEVYLPQDTIKNNLNVNFFLDRQFSGVLIKTENIPYLHKLSKTLRYDYQVAVGEVGYTISDFVFDFYAQETAANSVALGYGVIAAISALVSMLVIINIISFSITSRKKEIGILRAFGLSGGAASKVFVVESLIIGAFTLLLSIVTVNIVNIFINLSMTNSTYTHVIFTVVDFFTYSIMVFMSIIFVFIVSLIPIRRIVKMKPIDAIKDL